MPQRTFGPGWWREWRSSVPSRARRRGPVGLTVAALELTYYLMGGIGRFGFNADDNRVLVRCGLFQCRELAVEQGLWHEVPVPCDHALVDKLARSFQVDQHDITAVADYDVPIGP